MHFNCIFKLINNSHKRQSKLKIRTYIHIPYTVLIHENITFITLNQWSSLRVLIKLIFELFSILCSIIDHNEFI